MDSTWDTNLANPLCRLQNTTIMMVVFKISFVGSFEPPDEKDNLLVKTSQQCECLLDVSVKHDFTHEQATTVYAATSYNTGIAAQTGSNNQNVAASLIGFS